MTSRCAKHFLQVSFVFSQSFFNASPMMESPSADPKRSSLKFLGIIFDIMAAIVSLLDLITDVIILITWYQQDRMTFFYISLCILILAQISYIVVFYYNHGLNDGSCHQILSIICTIPFAPFLSFILYLVKDTDSSLRSFIDNYLCCYNFIWNDHASDPDASPQQQYLDEKLHKHIGFLLEALFEAFPQSICQLIVIIYYNEPNTISIISIFLSMTSVCSKILLVVLTANVPSWRMKFLTWLTFVIDFFGIFFVVSFAFYVPDNNGLMAIFEWIKGIYFYGFMVGILPTVILGSIGLHFYWTYKNVESNGIVWCPLIFCGFTVLWIIGILFSSLMMSIFCVLLPCLMVLYLSPSSRVPYKKIENEFFVYCIQWILSAEKIIDDNDVIMMNVSENKLLRLCIINKFMLEQHPEYKHKLDPNIDIVNGNWDTPWNNHYDERLLTYLQDEQEKDVRFKGVTLKSMLSHCDDSKYIYKAINKQGLSRYASRRHPGYLQTFWYEFYCSMLIDAYEDYKYDSTKLNGFVVVIMMLVTFITLPLYILTRFINVMMPLIILVMLYSNDYMLKDLGSFQVSMWIAYVVMLILWVGVLIWNVKIEWYLWHLLPSTEYLKASNDENEIKDIQKQMQDYYDRVTLSPLVERVLIDKFEVIEIAQLVLYYFDLIELDSK